MRCKVGGGFGEENTDKWTGEVKKIKRQGRNPLQCAKHAQLSFDLLQALKGRTFIGSGFSTEWALISVSAVPYFWVAFCACSHRANVMRVMNNEYFFLRGGGGGGF